MPNAWAIGLYNYSVLHPGAQGFKKFYDSALELFQQAGITPTYFAAEGVGYKGELTKFGGRTHAKALKTDFAGVHVMSLVANPAGSDEPGYDSFASASLGHVGESGETVLCLTMEERIQGFGSEAFERCLHSLTSLAPWDFGYALSQPIEKKPEFHVLGLDGGALTSEDRRRLNSWYASLPEERLSKIRDVYPYLILNNQQLTARISEAQTVEDIARSAPQSVLTQLEGTALWLWKIHPEAVGGLRDQLRCSGVLIT